jgi:hypothetical protein
MPVARSNFTPAIQTEMKTRILSVAAFLALALSARADDPVDYSAVLTTNLGHINTTWGTVAGIMIGSALVTVGVRFFRKAK